MIRLILLIFMAGFLSLFSKCKGHSKEKERNVETTPGKFKEGQVWNYNNRPGEDNSTLTILKIEEYEKETIIHIRVDGIKLYNPNVAGGYSDFIGHLPFSEKAILQSVTRLVGQDNNLPDFSEGIITGRRHGTMVRVVIGLLT